MHIKNCCGLTAFTYINLCLFWVQLQLARKYHQSYYEHVFITIFTIRMNCLEKYLALADGHSRRCKPTTGDWLTMAQQRLLSELTNSVAPPIFHCLIKLLRIKLGMIIIYLYNILVYFAWVIYPAYASKRWNGPSTSCVTKHSSAWQPEHNRDCVVSWQHVCYLYGRFRYSHNPNYFQKSAVIFSRGQVSLWY